MSERNLAIYHVRRSKSHCREDLGTCKKLEVFCL